ncbi:hypothetical protein JKP88DRAFT_294442 [Tribonema minus]|uniref:Pentacotripeptide-repeat region of PRORP domain-containing protein n=1 Tax=Tribonema minus TaxID=303371 RepID=A0A836CQL2_9STRA|nr:hypothetical protein JKP88DRAFT_294442 [Tribonema minus]
MAAGDAAGVPSSDSSGYGISIELDSNSKASTTVRSALRSTVPSSSPGLHTQLSQQSASALPHFQQQQQSQDLQQRRQKHGDTSAATAADAKQQPLQQRRPGNSPQLREALRRGHSGAVLQALQSMLESGNTPDAGMFDAAVALCMGNGQWRLGLKAFEHHLESAESQGRLPPLASFRLVIRGLYGARQPDPAVAVLHVALRGAPSSSGGGSGGAAVADPELCCLVLDLCADKRRMGLAEGVVAAMARARVTLSAVAYCILIKGYGRQRRAHMVDGALGAMRKARVVPDVVTLNAAVDAYVRCGELRRAQQVVRAMEASGGAGGAGAVPPNTRTYNTLIKGLGQAGRLEDAFAVARAMTAPGCRPDAVTANSLIEACIRCGQLTRAHALLRAPPPALDGSSSSGGGSGSGGSSAAPQWTPSVEAYTAVLTGFADAGDRQGALAVFQEMSAAGVEANLVTYTALLGACVKAGELEDARRVFAALQAKGRRTPALKPNTITYNTLIAGLCQGGGGAAAGGLAQRRGAGRSRTESHRGGAQRLAVAQPPSAPAFPLPAGIQEALKLLLDMRRKGVPPSEATVNAILDGMVSLSPPRMAEAEALRSLMTGWGLAPNSVTYSILIKGHRRCGNLESARAAFEELIAGAATATPDAGSSGGGSGDQGGRRGIGRHAGGGRGGGACVDVRALNCFLDACVRCGDVPLALATLADAARNPQQPAAAAAAAAADAPPPPRIDVRPDAVSYSTVALALARGGGAGARAAIALYEEMRARGLAPDAILVDGLLRACVARPRAGAAADGLRPEDGRRILADLVALGWDAAAVQEREEVLRAAVAALSEVWKAGRRGGGGRDGGGGSSGDGARAASSRLFDKYGWNSMDSNFKII